LERGGFDVWLRDDVGGDEVLSIESTAAMDPECPMHPDRASIRSVDRIAPNLWPNSKGDRSLVQAAVGCGCHVFLTYDRGVLSHGDALQTVGLLVTTPDRLLTLLDEERELEPVSDASPLLPDISALARFYSLVGPSN
jgi:hypothetical protein